MKVEINILGTGYVGLVTGLCLADTLNIKVNFIDRSADRIENLRNSQLPFFEPGLAKVFGRVKKSKNISFHQSLKEIEFNETQITFICVGTPSLKDGSADLSQIFDSVSEYVKCAKKTGQNHIVVIKSTVPPGTTKYLQQKHSANKLLHFAMVPEFLREGVAVEDACHPDRIIIGTESSFAEKILSNLFRKYSDCPIVIASPTEAELSKYANNALLALLISFSNEIAQLAESFEDVDAFRILQNVLLDKRWLVRNKSPEITTYLKPGCGFGGSCFPKDVAAISNLMKQQKIKSKIISNILPTNQDIKANVALRIIKTLGKGAPKSKVAILGLAFKPGTDDTRESPSIDIIKKLSPRVDKIYVHDSMAELPDDLKSIKNLFLSRDISEVLLDSSICFIATTWPEYLEISEKKYLKSMKKPVVFDGRGFLKNKAFKKVQYLTVGKKH